jgi:1-acyl-sn-glycerol-3-phosphate acyltransferase
MMTPMNKTKKIETKSRSYFLLKWYVDIMFKAAYRKVEFHGKEKIPRDGAIIYAPNHTNTLMDALAVLAMDKQEKVFVARADIFKHPLILKFLTFLKMLPINRKRDGLETLSKNEEVNNIVVNALHNRVPFCIMPEGTHRTSHGLLPLQKGLFRIALQANDLFGDKMPLYIVPVGIEFGHYFRYRSTLLVQLGDPINVTQLLKEHPNLSAPQQMNMLRDELADRLKKVVLHIPDDANYTATSELMQLYSREQHRRLRLSDNSLINRFISAKETIQCVASSLHSHPRKTKKLLNLTEQFSRNRDALGIGIESVLKPHIRLLLFGKLFYLLIGFPFFVYSSVVTAPITLLSMWLCSKFKDKAFHNTVRFLVSLALLPTFLLLLGIAVGFVCSWIWGFLFALLLIPSFFFVHVYLRWIRLFISDIKWLLRRDLYKQFKEIKIMQTRLSFDLLIL